MPRTHLQGAHRGLDAAANGKFGRFGRLFAGLEGPEFDDDALFAVAETMMKTDPGQFFNEEDDDENKFLPAAYTYFGQFVDHDLTLDKTALGESEADPDAVDNFRSAALDLDCVYGNGPWGDLVLYEQDFTLAVSGSHIDTGLPARQVGTQLDHRRDATGTALIGDPRNDENVIVAQIHQAFVSFHNKIMKTNALMSGVQDRTERFRRAHRLAGWHYQWVVVHDFLKRITMPEIYEDIVNPGGNPRSRLYDKPADLAVYPYMPIEFAGAAYRFGHSMVRPSYALNANAGVQQTGKQRIPIFDATPNNTDPRRDLRGFRAIPNDWGIDWGFFLDLPGTAPGTQLGTGSLQPAYRIDSFLVEPLAKLVNPDVINLSARDRHLAFRNLQRGSRLRLPTAEQVADAMHIGRFPAARFPMLSPEQIWSAGSKNGPPTGDGTIDKARQDRAALAADFEGATPLWYYILREAEWYGVRDPGDTATTPFHQRGKNDERGGHYLGPIGSTIVLETFIGLLLADGNSFLHQGGWRPRAPIAGSHPEKFDLKRLIEWSLT